jgi:hypothetical protein
LRQGGAGLVGQGGQEVQRLPVGPGGEVLPKNPTSG